MKTNIKTFSRAMIVSGSLVCALTSIGVHTASAATVSAMEQAYDESEAARDAMAGSRADRLETESGPAFAMPAPDLGTGRSLGACHGTHLDHIAGRC